MADEKLVKDVTEKIKNDEEFTLKVDIDDHGVPAVELVDDTPVEPVDLPVKAIGGAAGLALNLLYWGAVTAVSFGAGYLIGDAALKLQKHLPF
jgi:hypothetical protein